MHRASSCRGGGKAISVRLDDGTERALRLLESTGLRPSDAIRTSLISSANRLHKNRDLAAEVAALEADEPDRAEMLQVAALMESTRASGSDLPVQHPQGCR
jgi:antitoxin component of RelBE/YafQ-DinJ toxin-antitoxin module